MTTDEALSFVREHGVVLASAKGPVPRLAEAIAGEPIQGSWWAHPRSHQIFAVFQTLGAAPDILTCHLVNGKVTFVHRRLWPALVRAARLFQAERLAQVHEEHTPAGHHVTRERPFPEWVPAEVAEQARRLGETEACRALGAWVSSTGVAPTRRGRTKR